jgi:hypothetical protein
MSNRTAKFVAKFVSAVFASLLASSPLTTTGNAAGSGDDCLSGPKGETPAGRHWYYRIEHPSQRHCWYLRGGSEKVAQTAAPVPPAAATPVSIPPKPEAPMQPSVADARAELPAQLPAQQPNRLNVLNPALSADTPAIRQNTERQQSVIASRWPGSSDDGPAADQAPVKADPTAAANASPQPLPSPARLQPSPVVAASQYAAADASPQTAPSQTATMSLQMQLTTLAAALVLAGIVGSVIFRFGSARGPAQGGIRRRRGANWEPTDDDSIVLSAEPGPELRAHRPRFARNLDRADDPTERIAEFIAQLSKRASG